jgi:hypothetical protein
MYRIDVSGDFPVSRCRGPAEPTSRAPSGCQPACLAGETARLREIRHQLTDEAEHWWQALLANDEDTVCEAVNTAFSDNPAAGCAVGADGSVLSVVVRQPDLDQRHVPDPAATTARPPSRRVWGRT